jgi:aspartyl-tRNA(Asn)/glutamyl-tRNA(Gln) amidotransferase subunit C
MPTDLDIHHVAHLARIDLTEAEEIQFKSQLGQILEYVDQLAELDVTGVDPTAHANPVVNVFRADIPKPSLDKKAALSNAPHQANGLVMVTRVIE